MGLPWRILKFAIDFFARVTTGRCPVIATRSAIAESSALAFWIASPRPILTTTLTIRGTCISFPYPNSCLSAGTISC
jgi:hypothetical protein